MIFYKKILQLENIKKNLVRYCNYQERCHWDINKKLNNYELKEIQKKEIINYLIKNNLLNEERFTKLFIQGKLLYRQWGRKKIIQELRLKGVEERVIQNEIQTIGNKAFNNALNNLLKKKSILLTGKIFL